MFIESEFSKGDKVVVTKGFNKNFRGTLMYWDADNGLWAVGTPRQISEGGPTAMVWAKPENITLRD